MALGRHGGKPVLKHSLSSVLNWPVHSSCEPPTACSVSEDRNSIWKSVTDSSRVEYLAGAILVAFIVGVGVWPFPWIELIDGSVSSIIGNLS